MIVLITVHDDGSNILYLLMGLTSLTHSIPIPPHTSVPKASPSLCRHTQASVISLFIRVDCCLTARMMGSYRSYRWVKLVEVSDPLPPVPTSPGTLLASGGRGYWPPSHQSWNTGWEGHWLFKKKDGPLSVWHYEQRWYQFQVLPVSWA